jgi:hypothetical protein
MNTLIKDARVENTASIQKFQLDNHYDTTNSFIAKADTATAMMWLQRGIAGYEIYNSKREMLDFTGTTECSGSIFQFFLENKLDSFQTDSSNTLPKLLDNVYDYKEKKVTINNLPQTDFYVVVFWAKFAGRTFGYKEGPKYYEDEIKKETLKKHSITLIKINTDLQESWGMKPNGKMSVKVRVHKDEGDFVFGKLPIKK